MTEAPTRAETYDRLSAALKLDLLRIDQELVAMPGSVQEAAELASAAQADEHGAKHALDIITAEASARLREDGEGGKPRSEARIFADLPLEEDVQAARTAYDAARLESSRCSALYNSMREKVRLLGKACDMTIAGYITPSSYAPRRTQLARPATPAKEGT